jgi:hypothetical protein
MGHVRQVKLLRLIIGHWSLVIGHLSSPSAPSPRAFPARKNEKRKMANDQSTTAALNLAHMG